MPSSAHNFDCKATSNVSHEPSGPGVHEEQISTTCTEAAGSVGPSTIDAVGELVVGLEVGDAVGELVVGLEVGDVVGELVVALVVTR